MCSACTVSYCAMSRWYCCWSCAVVMRSAETAARTSVKSTIRGARVRKSWCERPFERSTGSTLDDPPSCDSRAPDSLVTSATETFTWWLRAYRETIDCCTRLLRTTREHAADPVSVPWGVAQLCCDRDESAVNRSTSEATRRSEMSTPFTVAAGGASEPQP